MIVKYIHFEDVQKIMNELRSDMKDRFPIECSENLKYMSTVVEKIFHDEALDVEMRDQFIDQLMLGTLIFILLQKQVSINQYSALDSRDPYCPFLFDFETPLLGDIAYIQEQLWGSESKNKRDKIGKKEATVLIAASHEAPSQLSLFATKDKEVNAWVIPWYPMTMHEATCHPDLDFYTKKTLEAQIERIAEHVYDKKLPFIPEILQKVFPSLKHFIAHQQQKIQEHPGYEPRGIPGP